MLYTKTKVSFRKYTIYIINLLQFFYFNKSLLINLSVTFDSSCLVLNDAKLFCLRSLYFLILFDLVPIQKNIAHHIYLNKTWISQNIL